MPIDISNINNSTAQTKRTSEQKHVKIVHSGSADNAGSTASLNQDSVNLTDAATRINALQEQIARLPIIDTQKVEQVRSSINDGTFEFNSDRIAEKIIRFEYELR